MAAFLRLRLGELEKKQKETGSSAGSEKNGRTRRSPRADPARSSLPHATESAPASAGEQRITQSVSVNARRTAFGERISPTSSSTQRSR